MAPRLPTTRPQAFREYNGEQLEGALPGSSAVVEVERHPQRAAPTDAFAEIYFERSNLELHQRNASPRE